MQSRIFISAALVAAAAMATPAQAADVGVSIGISQPGVYGRIDIGRFPQPQVIVQQPVLVQPRHYRQPVQPVYLWVPPGHQQNWSRHCGRYNACGAPVYFVQDRWYREQGPGRRWEDGRRNDREDHRDQRRDERRDERGNGRGHGHGHNHGNGRG
jgi:hypothetical protein